MTQAATGKPLFRAEVVGSLLRPHGLKDAGRALTEGRLSPEAFEARLEAEMARAIARQEEIGLKVVTDGEFARSSWFGFFFEGLEGFRLAPSHFKFRDADGRAFEWPTCVAERRIVRRVPIALREFERASRHVRRATVKATLPAPSAFHFFRLGQAVDPTAYADASAYFDDLAELYRAEVAELTEAGCRYLQLNEVPVAMLCDPDVRGQVAAEGGEPAALLDTYIGLITRVLAGRPACMTTGMHLCRGNFRSRWMASGGYEPVADKLFNETPVDVFLLEYDTERAGDFSPLRFVPEGKRVVLGLVSSKTPEAGGPGQPAAAHRGGRAPLPAGSAGPLRAVRLCQRGWGQRPHRGSAMGQAGTDRRHGAARLGIVGWQIFSHFPGEAGTAGRREHAF